MIKSFGKSKHGCCDHKTSRNITCCADMREIFVWGEGGLVVCRWGELGLGRRRRNRGGEGRWTYINFHRRNIRRLNRWWFWRNNRHVTARICHFKSVSDSVGNINGGHCTGCLFESVGDSVWKNNPPKPPRQRPVFFFTTKTFPSIIQSVTTDGNCLSVVTDWITDGILSVGNFDLKVPTEIFRQ